MHTLETAIDRLTFDGGTGRLMSLSPRALPEVELLASAPDHPAVALQYLNDDGEYRYTDSHAAARTEIACEASDAAQTLTMAFLGLDDLDVDVILTVRTVDSDDFARWSCRVRNGAGIRLVDVQFPVLVVPDHGTVIQPLADDKLLVTGETLQELPADEPEPWQFRADNEGGTRHYPGRNFAQFLAWYNDAAGVYIACEDGDGSVKRLHALRRPPGIRLGMSHVGDWPTSGERTLEYDVVLRSFSGDWYDAADIYRTWTLAQKWATPLTARTDIPSSLLDSPVHITFRVQGYLDDGPAPPVEEFLPYEKCTPLLAAISQRVGAPLVAIAMAWERNGPWIYPECFPPVGGDESLAEFVRQARDRGWHVGLFCNGTRWVTQHFHMDYDGREFFAEQGGAGSVCRLANGEPWPESWDADWRPSYLGCLAQPQTKALAADAVQRIVGWGMESIQFFDQNFSAASFPCFAADHGHPPSPGKWMAAAMHEMVDAFRQLATASGEAETYQCVEMGCNEFCLQLFAQTDERISSPGSGNRSYIPLYQYLFHECIIINGMMSVGPEPFALPIRNAWNGVLGEIPGGVLTGDGTLLNRETFNWAAWEPKVGNDDDALEMIRTVTAMRRGPGRDFLVYGRMLRPARVDGNVVSWVHDDCPHEVPAIAHAAWQAPNGHFGLVLANWTTAAQPVDIVDSRLGDRVTVHVCGEKLHDETRAVADGKLSLSLPRLSCVLICR